MPTVHLARILKDLGTTSVWEMFRHTGSSENSVFKQGQIAAINSLYNINKGYRGFFGFPLDEAEFNGNTATRNYSGGQIHFLDNRPQGGDENRVVRVRFLGFHCDAESSSDPAFWLR
jgi:hypothetical protein